MAAQAGSCGHAQGVSWVLMTDPGEPPSQRTGVWAGSGERPLGQAGEKGIPGQEALGTKAWVRDRVQLSQGMPVWLRPVWPKL